MPYQVLDIANLLLAYANQREYGDLTSNLKLQKMLYYQQGFHLAYFDAPLFNEDFEAWMYGPVIPSVYEHFKRYGNKGIEPPTDTLVELTREEEALFQEVFYVYDEYSASGLVRLTHSETPWKSTPCGVGHIISKESMTKFFKERLQ